VWDEAGTMTISPDPGRGNRGLRALVPAAGVSLRLDRIGYGAGMIAAGEPLAMDRVGDRRVAERPEIREWYVNSEGGLEHGFTLDARPAGAGAGGSLTIAMAVNTALHPLAEGDGDGIVFVDDAGRGVWAYRRLVVTDAVGD